MKRKIAVSLLVLVVAIICCACGPETRYKTISSNHSSTSQEEVDPSEPNDNTPMVYITKYGDHYHRYGCSHAKRIYLELTVKQASNRGYTACYYCCF